jgi:4a-hydroxytetrahydrobiopterin dehydratase
VERKILSAKEIREKLNELDGWTAEDNNLKKRFSFTNFAESLNFVNKAGEIAERLDHHPDITFGWGYAEFAMTTHDRGGITDFDFTLAKEIDAIE